MFEIDNILCRGTIQTANFKTDTISVVGGSVLVRPGDALSSDMTALDNSTLTIIGNDTFAVDDILRIKDGLDDEWFIVTNIAAAPIYTVTRDMAGMYGTNNNPIWTKGVAVVNYGPTGDGGVLLTSSLTHSPYVSIFTHAGNPWTTVTERGRFGNLNGYLGYGSDVHGVGIGSVASGEANLTFDPTNGIRLRQGATNLMTFDMSGNAQISGFTIGVSDGFYAGSGVTRVQMKPGGGFWCGATLQEDAPFRVTASGILTASSVIITGQVITGPGSSIDGQYIENATITGGKIDSATITGNNIGSATITGGNIAGATITATQIAAATITANQIASATITGNNIGSATITGGNIAGATITATQIAATTITASQIVNATITATQIANATITGGKIANATITGGKIANATITGGKIANSTITGGNVVNQAITAGKIENLTITASQIANLTITGGSGGKIATSTISEDNIVANTITALSIAADAITTSELAADSVTANHIVANTITTSEINTTAAFVGMTIQSTTYTPGSVGWQINANGDVDFTSGTATWSMITGTGKPADDADVSPGLPSDENLIGYWAFDEGSGLFSGDGSANSNNGTLEGSMTDADWVPGASGAGLEFDGTNDRVNCGNGSPLNNINNNHDFTISFWMKSHSVINAYGRLFNKVQNADNQLSIYSSNQTNQLRMYCRSGGVNRISGTFSDINPWDENLHHIVLIFSFTDGKVYAYQDGVKSSNELSLPAGNWSNTGDVVWGATSTGSSSYRGMLDELRIYNKTLTEIERKALYLYPAGNKASLTLDSLPNGTTYGRVLTTAISAGKIVLTSSGVTGTLSTSLTAAKCTVAAADETSAQNQNLGWLIGSTGELTISAGGRLKLNCDSALEIQANGSIKILSTTGVATGKIKAVASHKIGLYPIGTSKVLDFGRSSEIWDSIYMISKTLSINAEWNGSNNVQLYQYSYNNGSYFSFIVVKSGATKNIFYTGNNFYPGQNKTCNLGTASYAWDNAYADDWYNVADFYNFDIHDDLAAINGIKGSGVIQEHNGYELIDDNTLPMWLLSKYKKDGEDRDKETQKVLNTWKKGDIIYDPDSKPYLSLKACISLCWGAIRQLDRKIEVLNEKPN